MLYRSLSPLARLEALSALDGLHGLLETHLVQALRDRDAAVREHALILCETLFPDGMVSDNAWTSLRRLTADPSLRVRHQLMCTLGELRRPERSQTLAELLQRDFREPAMRAAALNTETEQPSAFFIAVAGSGLASQSAGREFLRQLAMQIGLQNNGDEVARVLNWLLTGNVSQEQSLSY